MTVPHLPRPPKETDNSRRRVFLSKMTIRDTPRRLPRGVGLHAGKILRTAVPNLLPIIRRRASLIRRS